MTRRSISIILIISLIHFNIVNGSIRLPIKNEGGLPRVFQQRRNDDEQFIEKTEREVKRIRDLTDAALPKITGEADSNERKEVWKKYKVKEIYRRVKKFSQSMKDKSSKVKTPKRIAY